MKLALFLALALAAPALAAKPAERTVTGRGVKFTIPAVAATGRFTEQDDGRAVYRVATNVKGLGQLTVFVGPRGDPESTLANELVGAQATGKLPLFRRTRARVIDFNRSRANECFESTKSGGIAHAIGWSARRQFELSLEGTSGTDPLTHAVWRRLMTSFRSDEPPLKLKK